MSPRTKDFYEKFGLNKESHPLGVIMQSRRLDVIKGFLKKMNKADSLGLLIVGCGSQTDMFIPADEQVCSSQGIKVAFDLSHNSVKVAREKYPLNKYLVADATSLPFKNKCFDGIICSEVLEHVTAPQKAIQEFHRTLNDKGYLVLTVPNWISWYGLARKSAELILRRPVTSVNQPIDDWYTYSSLKKITADKFNIRAKQGIWYFPPTGRGMRVLSDKITVPIYKLFQPLERVLEGLLPKCGHMLALLCIKKEENG
jgi:ubiquinone/menaquinone biosynthesis C-methylase UbiE